MAALAPTDPARAWRRSGAGGITHAVPTDGGVGIVSRGELVALR